MKDVVTIAPLAGDPGLIAYECPDCGHLTSVLVPPTREEVERLLLSETAPTSTSQRGF
jgi:hypothetical protein